MKSAEFILCKLCFKVKLVSILIHWGRMGTDGGTWHPGSKPCVPQVALMAYVSSCVLLCLPILLLWPPIMMLALASLVVLLSQGGGGVGLKDKGSYTGGQWHGWRKEGVSPPCRLILAFGVHSRSQHQPFRS